MGAPYWRELNLAKGHNQQNRAGAAAAADSVEQGCDRTSKFGRLVGYSVVVSESGDPEESSALLMSMPEGKVVAFQ
ncbi:hypothetical protein D5086_026532 [Populus alba]|uniref:Uncharacterized protein n=1 Tax=Populus alba TaxID=43335 RepID=A0ACC4B3U5_POPAL